MAERERDDEQGDWTPETREAFRAKKRGKNLALMGVLLAFVVIVYIVALVRMGGS
jgi:hypothetical protein